MASVAKWNVLKCDPSLSFFKISSKISGEASMVNLSAKPYCIKREEINVAGVHMHLLLNTPTVYF